MVSVTPLRLALKSLILELNDSALALVFLVLKTESPVRFTMLFRSYCIVFATVLYSFVC